MYCFLLSAKEARVWALGGGLSFLWRCQCKREAIRHNPPMHFASNPTGESGFCCRQTGPTLMNKQSMFQEEGVWKAWVTCSGWHILICRGKFDQSNNRSISVQWFNTHQAPGSVLLMKPRWPGNKQLISHPSGPSRQPGHIYSMSIAVLLCRCHLIAFLWISVS